MHGSDPLDYVKRYIRWPYDRLRERAFSPRKKPLPIPTPGIFDSPYACVKINYSWVSHLIGIVETLLDLDSWEGTEEEQYLAKQEVEKLLATLGAACPEEEIVTSFRFTMACGMEYSNDNGETWIPVPGWSDFADSCFVGPPGEDGEDGAPGADGAPGEDGEDCECPTDGGVGPQPPIPNNEDWDATACAIATVISDYLSKKWNQHVAALGAWFQAGLILFDIVENFIESFPVVITGLITTVTNFVESVLEYDIAELQRLNDFEFVEAMTCVLYCPILAKDGFTTADLEDVLFNDLQPWLIARGLEGPLLTAFGPLFAAYIPVLNLNDIMRRVQIWQEKPAICAFCDDCPDESCDPLDLTWISVGATPGQWTAYIGTLDVSAWEGDTTGLQYSPPGVLVQYTGARSSGENWSRTGPAATANGLALTYTPDVPCLVSELFTAYSKNSTNSVIQAIVVRRDSDGIYQVVARRQDGPGGPITAGSLEWTGTPILAREVLFLTHSSINTGTHTLSMTRNKVNAS